MKNYLTGLAVLAGIILGLIGFHQYSVIAAPSLEYLGEGGSYTIDPGLQFIVKRRAPFRFENEPGPTYNAAAGERVWSSTGGAPPAHVTTWVDYGQVPANCQISYVAIDDDPDDRINRFYIDGDAVHEMPQGLVTGASFNTPRAGNLRLEAVDSIGIWLDKCPSEENTPTPESPTPQSPTATPSPTPGEGTPTATPGGPTSTPDVPQPTNTRIAPSTTPTVPGGTTTATPTPTRKPRLLACLRINFELGGDKAREGLYEVREVGGRLLYTWYAQGGWTDSGWIHNIDISFENVYVEVFYIPPDGSPPIKMRIVNPAPGTEYGWLARGQCHALEVAWPERNPTPTPDAYDGFNDYFDLQELELQKYIWPDQQPEPTSAPATSLRG